MALIRGKVEEIPRDAVRLSEEEAVHYQFGRLQEANITEFKYGPGILGGMGAITGVFVNNHYRTRLRLGRYGLGSTYLPIVVLPSIMSAIFHRLFIQSNIIIWKEKCPLCLQLRAAAFQGFFGTVYPVMLAPLAAYMFAVRHYTYKIPSITENPRAAFAFYKKLTRPISMGIMISLGFNTFVAAYLTYREQLAFAKYTHEQLIEERRIESKI